MVARQEPSNPSPSEPDRDASQEALDAEADARYRAKRRKLVVGACVAPFVIIGGYLLIAHLSGGAVPTFGLPLGGERGELRRMTAQFWEDLQFKDYERAARYHDAQTQEEVDVPFLIQRLFKVKPESLDIMDYEILMVDIDRSELRARVKSKVRVKVLTSGEVRDVEAMLYYKRTSPDAPWFMDLENSLRPASPDKNKKY